MEENTSDRNSNEGTRLGERAPSQLRKDSLYRALAAQPRRRALFYLLEQEASTIDDVAAMLVGWETTETGGMATQDDHEQMKTLLWHVHLPVLAEAGLVTVDDETGEVRLDTVDEAVAELLQQCMDADE